MLTCANVLLNLTPFPCKTLSSFWTGTRGNLSESLNALYFEELHLGSCGVSDDDDDDNDDDDELFIHTPAQSS